MAGNEFQGLFGDAEIFWIGRVKDDFRLIIQILFFIVSVDPFEVRPVPLIQRVNLLGRIALSPSRISADKMIQIQIDIASDPVIQRPLAFIILAVVTSFPVTLKELIHDRLF